MEISLRDFWFPILLFIASCTLALAAFYAGKVWRRTMMALTVLLFALAIIAFIYGDPVRGPFTYLVHPHAKDTVVFHAGVSARIPYKKLGDGFDFSNLIKFTQPESGQQPIELRIRKTWPFNWHITVSLFRGKDPILIFKDNEIDYIAPGADVNHDSQALEFVVSQNQDYPSFQLIFSGDDIYLNAVLVASDKSVVIMMNGNTLSDTLLPKVQKTDLPKLLFKYPAYMHEGERL